MDNCIRLKPTQRQLDFLSWEFGMFFHFGIRSFYLGHRDWDGREMPTSGFLPDNLDCEQWISTSKQAGAKYAILTAKHHDGFANWPSKYTEYSVANTPWKQGKGDVVAEFVAACRKYGLKVGLYYSPAQWGEGAVSFTEEKEYDDYFINQISELLTGYGKIDYLWFDGNGSGDHEYDVPRIIKAIRSMQTEILIFSMWDPNTRWIGNEDGYAPSPNPYTVPQKPHFRLSTEEEKRLGMKFLPGECDCKMRSTWFDCEENEDTIKTLEELVGMYEYSVGRGANFLLNIGPSRTGRLPEKDTARLLELGEEIRRRYGSPVGNFSELTPAGAADSFCIISDKNEIIDRVAIEEDLTDGESVTGFKVYAHLPAYRSEKILVYTGTTIGSKAICVFPAIRTAKLVVEITGHCGDYKLKSMKPYKA